MFKHKIYSSIFVGILLLCGCKSMQEPVDLSLEQAKPIAEKMFSDYANSNSANLISGPCLGIIANKWAVDIVNVPRLKTDNLPENLCQDYTNGKVKHLIEFDARGQIVTIK